MTANAPSRLHQLRAASRAMLDGFSDAQLHRQSHADLSPLAWHVGHVFFVENYWLAERVFGDTGITDIWRELYFPEMCAKNTRGTRLPGADELRAWSLDVERVNDSYWQRADSTRHALLERGYLSAFLRQHYAQHLETMRLVTAQLRQAEGGHAPARVARPRPPRIDRRTLAAHRARIGTATIQAYDNEQPAAMIDIASFEIAANPVTNAEWLGFMHAGGYADPSFWDAAGWVWRQVNQVHHPQHWRPLGAGTWQLPTDPAQGIGGRPVHGISWYEARAFARYAGARLPHEIEWEAARRAGVLGGCDEVWEWCNNAFYPYTGFRAFPYAGYSQTWFDGQHAVTRGASRHTEVDIRRPGFRNFFPFGHRHVCAGLRLAW